METSGFEPDSQVHDLVTLGRTIIAVGAIGGWDGAAAAWTSIDGGTTWAPSLLPRRISQLTGIGDGGSRCWP